MAVGAGSRELPVTVVKINGDKVAELTMAGDARVRSLRATIASIIHMPPQQVDLLAECRQLGDDERLDRIARTASLGGPLELAVTVVISDREVHSDAVDIHYVYDVNIGITDPDDMYAQQLEDELEEEIAKDTNFQILLEAGMPLRSSCQQTVELKQMDLENWRQQVLATTELQLPVTVVKINGDKMAELTMAGDERVRSLRATIASIIHMPPQQVDLLAECRQLGDDERLDRIEQTASPGGPLELAVTVVISDREVDSYAVDIFYENDDNIGITDLEDMFAQQLEDELEEEIANAKDTKFPDSS